MIYIVNDINGIHLGVSFGVEEFDGVNDIYINIINYDIYS